MHHFQYCLFTWLLASVRAGVSVFMVPYIMLGSLLGQFSACMSCTEAFDCLREYLREILPACSMICGICSLLVRAFAGVTAYWREYLRGLKSVWERTDGSDCVCLLEYTVDVHVYFIQFVQKYTWLLSLESTDILCSVVNSRYALLLINPINPPTPWK